MNYWLLKSEPNTFSIDHLKKMPKKTEHWDGVRNYQARNFMRDEMNKGDLAFFYHSNCTVPGIVGVVEIVKESYPDFTALDPESNYFDPKSNYLSTNKPFNKFYFSIQKRKSRKDTKKVRNFIPAKRWHTTTFVVICCFDSWFSIHHNYNRWYFRTEKNIEKAGREYIFF